MLVRDIEIGQLYWIQIGNAAAYLGELIEKRIIGAGGSGFQEPYYKIKFDTGKEYIMDWDVQLIK